MGCRHHLLIEVARGMTPTGKPVRATSLRLNVATKGRTGPGRRKGLLSSAAAVLVRSWIDEAVEALSRMPYTCSLDVVEAYPDGAPDSVIAQCLGVHEQLVDAEWRAARLRWVDGMRERGALEEGEGG